jgi:hypothetical protein
VRALFVLCLLAGPAHAELPTIESEFPPTLRVESTTWGVTLERVGIEIRSAPEVTFVTIDVGGREREATIPLDVPVGTKLVGLGIDSSAGRAWGRPMQRSRVGSQGSVMKWDSTSAEQDHYSIHVNGPGTIEVALFLPPLPRIAIATTASALSISVDGEKLGGKHKRVVVELADLAGTQGAIEMPHVTEDVSFVASPSGPSDFVPVINSSFGAPMGHRNLDKTMIRRRMKWFQPGLRQCFMHAAQWSGLRSGGAVMAFMITGDGNVAFATATESDLPASVNACLEEQVMRWEFPAADGNVHVNYPVTFHAVE